jgi:hypothetical protein
MRHICLLFCLVVLAACAHGRRHQGPHSAHAMEMMDEDKDGKLTKAEWGKHFDSMDADKNGEISSEEMQQAHKGKGCSYANSGECLHCRGSKGPCKDCDH